MVASFAGDYAERCGPRTLNVAVLDHSTFFAGGFLALWEQTGGTFKAVGSTGDATALQLRLEMSYFDLAEKNPELAAVDDRLREHNRRRWELIRPQNSDARLPAPVAAT